MMGAETMHKLAASAVLVLAAALAATAVARGATVAVSSTVAAGSTLSVASNGSPTFGITLTGADQTTTYTLPVTVIDARGSGAGWNLTVTSTTFNDNTNLGAGHTFPTSASTITAATSGCATGSTCTLPTDGVSYTSPLTLPAEATAPTAVKYFDGAVNTGLGKMNINATVSVTIPANVFAGSYTSTVTVAIVNGP
jgi:hypothetical protein